jgi:hypothetical protein
LKPVAPDRRKILVTMTSETVLEDAIRAFSRDGDLRRKPSVKYIGQHGIDGSGLTRQFLQDLSRKLPDAPIFIGPENSKELQLNSQCMQILSFI